LLLYRKRKEISFSGDILMKGYKRLEVEC